MKKTFKKTFASLMAMSLLFVGISGGMYASAESKNMVGSGVTSSDAIVGPPAITEKQYIYAPADNPIEKSYSKFSRYVTTNDAITYWEGEDYITIKSGKGTRYVQLSTNVYNKTTGKLTDSDNYQDTLSAGQTVSAIADGSIFSRFEFYGYVFGSLKPYGNATDSYSDSY